MVLPPVDEDRVSERAVLTQPPNPRAREVMKRVARRRSRESVYECSGVWAGEFLALNGTELGDFGERKDRRPSARDELVRGWEWMAL